MKPAVRVVLICILFASVLAGVGPGAAAQTSGDFTIEDPIIVKSKDGTPIVATLMLPAGASRKSPAPVVLQTHGWGGTRAKSPSFPRSRGATSLEIYFPEACSSRHGTWCSTEPEARLRRLSESGHLRVLRPASSRARFNLAFAQGIATGDMDDGLKEWFATRSTTRRSHQVDAPTLIIQGTVDTLFPLNDGFENYLNLVRAGTPAKLMTYCAGHTLGCDYPGGSSGDPKEVSAARSVPDQRVLAWLDRYVRNRPVDTGARVEWQAQDGYYYAAPSFPLPDSRYQATRPLTGVSLIGPGATGGDELASAGPAPQAEIGLTAHRATILRKSAEPRAILGNPRISIAGEALGVKGHSFYELVDAAPDGTRVTLDDQTMPRALPLGAFDKSFEMHGVSWMLKAGHRLELEITTGSTQYSIPRTGPYRVTFDEVAVELPLTRWPAHRHRIAP